MKRITAVFLVILLAFSSLAITVSAESGSCGMYLTWSFDADSGLLTILGTGVMTDDMPWENHRRDIRTVVIEDGVTDVGKSAFQNCANLKCVTIPDSVETIGEWAFYACENLETVQFGNDLQCIGNNAFRQCENLVNAVLPDSVTQIGDFAFEDCACLSQLAIPESVIRIGRYAFKNCTGITDVTITDGVQIIGDYAFSDCTNLANVTIPDSVTKIGDNVFSATAYFENEDNWTNDMLRNGIHLIRVKKTISGACTVPAGTVHIADSAFAGCADITAISIPDSVTRIGDDAFRRCTSLTEVDIPNSVTQIGESLFYECRNLARVTLPEGITSIGFGAFGVCLNLTDVTIPSSVTSIGTSAFFRCQSLTEMTIPSSVTTIETEAFNGCSNLARVHIPASVTKIGGSAFARCTALTAFSVDPDNTGFSTDESGVLFDKQKTKLVQYTVGNPRASYAIPEGVTVISPNAFSLCTNLKTVMIPQSMTEIGNSAFFDCGSLESVTIPDSVTDLDMYAFCNCSNLAQITIPDSVTAIRQHAFHGCMNLAELTIPDSVKWIGDYAFSECTSLLHLTIPGTVETIYDYAFSFCTSLRSVVIEPGAEITEDGPGVNPWSGVIDPGGIDCDDLGWCPAPIEEAACVKSETPGDTAVRINHAVIFEYAFQDCSDLQYIHIPASIEHISDGILNHTRAYICSDTADCAAKAYADENDIEFRVCNGHDSTHEHEYYAFVTEATCTTGGYTTYMCICGDTCTGDITEPLGHDYNVTETAATCETGGFKTYICKRCDDSYTADETDPLGHDYDVCVIAATCEAGGCTTYTCKRCGDSYTENMSEPLGHAWGEWIVVTKPAVGAEGLKKRECTRCTAAEEQAIEPLTVDAGTVKVTDAVVGCSAGRRVKVIIELHGNPGIVATRLHIGYNPQILRLVEVQNGNIFPEESFTPGGNLALEPYTVLWLDALTRADYTADGTLATLTFEVQPTAVVGDTAVTVTCDAYSTRNSAMRRMLLETADGTVSVAECTPGDADGDNVISLADVAGICRAIAGGWDVTINGINGDVNGDGALDLKDVVLMRRYLAGGWDVELI